MSENDLTIEDYKEAIADYQRLTRELDIALNGEEGAAKQAMLCDIIDQVKKIKRPVYVVPAGGVLSLDDRGRLMLAAQKPGNIEIWPQEELSALQATHLMKAFDLNAFGMRFDPDYNTSLVEMRAGDIRKALYDALLEIFPYLEGKISC